jgi:putative component of toxin-antitoxin plasmid stabilization module
MKKILFVLSVGFTFIAVSIKCTYAQSSQILIDPNIKKNFLSSIRNLAGFEGLDLADSNALKRNEINIRAVRDFLNRFDKVDDALWFAGSNEGLEAYFIKDGFGDRVLYDKYGNWLMSLITSHEEKLPRNIRYLVKSTYYDFDIILVEELRIREGAEYIVYLEDKFNIKIVKVNNGDEMEVLQELNK